MKQELQKHLSDLSVTLLEDKQRTRMQFICVYFILSVVSVFMTVVNAFTQKYTLMIVTLLFAVVNLFNLFLSIGNERNRQLSSILFSIEMTLLFIFFIVSGEPEGFSAIWVCMLPASGLLLFGKKRGSMLCVLELGIVLFFFYLPMGKALLQYEYTSSFQLRFPMLYIAFFAVAFLLETIRVATYDALQESRRQYQHLYSHDALTNVYNRYGFNEHMDALLRAPSNQQIALLILDIDYFKGVNDRYGHTSGDIVLKAIASLLLKESKENAAVCRWGGEEFAVILNDATASTVIAENIMNAIRDLTIPIEEEKIQVTVSMGMVIAPPHTSISPQALVTQTDRCLYEAKESGRDRIVCQPYQVIDHNGMEKKEGLN